VGYAGEPELASLWANSIFDFEMAGLHPHLDPKACKGEDTAFTNGGFAG
jgi:hypothetical protein